MANNELSPLITRRSLFRVGAALGLSALAAGSADNDMGTLPDGSVLSYDGTPGGDIQTMALTQPADNQDQDVSQLPPADQKTLAEANNLNAQAEETRAKAKALDATAEKDRAIAEDTRANAGNTRAKTKQQERETELTGTPGDRAADLAPYAAAAGTLLGVAITAGVTHHNNVKTRVADAAKARETQVHEDNKARDERAAQARAATETKFNEVATRLLSSLYEDAAKNNSAGADVELLSFTSLEYADYHERIFHLAVGLLRSRKSPVEGQPIEPPSTFDENILQAFLAVTRSLREEKLDEAGKLAYQQGQKLPSAEMAIAQDYLVASPVLDAKGIKLHGMTLISADLSNLDLTGATFRGATLSRSVFYGSDMDGVDLRDVRGRGLTIAKCSVDGMRVAGSKLQLGIFQELDMREMSLLSAVGLQGARIDGTVGLDEEKIAKLKKRGVIVNERADYLDLATAEGDTPN